MPFGTIISNSTIAAVNTPSVEGFWNFCWERELIRVRKATGEPPPWTENKNPPNYHLFNLQKH